MVQKKQLLLGGHMPILAGIEKAVMHAEALGFAAIQLFIYSNAEWIKHEMTADQIDQFTKALQGSSIQYVIGLDPYFTRFGFFQPERSRIMCDLVADELNLCEELGIQYLIIHPGTCSRISSVDECFFQISDHLDTVFKSTMSTKPMIVLQNMPGAGKSIFYSFEHLARLYNESTYKNRLGFCFDMANAFAGGYTMRSLQEYEAMWQEFDRFIGFDKLKVIHINDSQEPAGKGITSHAFIGKGQIPFEAFRLIMNDKRFFDIPKIIEIPAETINDYKESMRVLIDLLEPVNKQLFGLE